MKKFSERRMEAMIKACHGTKTHKLCGDRLKECVDEIRRLKAFEKTRAEEIVKILNESKLRPDRLRKALKAKMPDLPAPKK